MELGVWATPIIICPTHKGKARATVKVRCLEAVNTNGHKPSALFAMIYNIKATGARVSPGALEAPRMAPSSELRYDLNNCIVLDGTDGRLQKIEGITITTREAEIQFKGMLNKEVGSNTENKLFIS